MAQESLGKRWQKDAWERLESSGVYTKGCTGIGIGTHLPTAGGDPTFMDTLLWLGGVDQMVGKFLLFIYLLVKLGRTNFSGFLISVFEILKNDWYIFFIL